MKKTLETYMNDPDIVKEPLPLREIHAIRLMLNDETKELTPEARTARTSAESQALLHKFGISLETVEARP